MSSPQASFVPGNPRLRSEVVEFGVEAVPYSRLKKCYCDLFPGKTSLPKGAQEGNWLKARSGQPVGEESFLLFADLLADMFAWKVTYGELCDPSCPLLPVTANKRAGFRLDDPHKKAPPFLPPTDEPSNSLRADGERFPGAADAGGSAASPADLDVPAAASSWDSAAPLVGPRSSEPREPWTSRVLLTITTLLLAGALVWCLLALEKGSRAQSALATERTELRGKLEGLATANAQLSTENGQLRSYTAPLALLERLKLDRPPEGITFLSALFHRYDPAVFPLPEGSDYEFARLVPDRTALRTTTDLVAELRGTQQSFDLHTNVGGAFVDQLPLIEEGVKRGVRCRLIFSDYRPTNNRLGPFLEDVNEGGAAPAREVLRLHHQHLDDAIQRLKAAGGAAPGSLEVRWNRKLLLYGLWLRDRELESALAHLEVFLYRGKPAWPCLRTSRTMAPELMQNLAEEFEFAWKAADPYEAIPLGEATEGSKSG